MRTLATVCVTYNRKELLLRNIKNQLSQTFVPQRIIIIDNASTDGTYDFLKEQGVLDNINIIYHNTGNNLGGAGGFCYGIKKACEYNDDLICLMDDDGYPYDKDCFLNVINSMSDENFKDPIFVNSAVVYSENDLTFPQNELKTIDKLKEKSVNNFYEGYVSPFNGTFINKKLVELIGYPREEFFLRYDEADYYYRAKRRGVFLGTIVNSIYFHPNTVKKRETKKLFGLSFNNEYEVGWKEYYKVRNNYRIQIENGTSALIIYLKYLKYVFGLYIFNINDKKNIKQFIKLGYKDAMNNKLGKRIQPGQKSIGKEYF